MVQREKSADEVPMLCVCVPTTACLSSFWVEMLVRSPQMSTICLAHGWKWPHTPGSWMQQLHWNLHPPMVWWWWLSCVCETESPTLGFSLSHTFSWRKKAAAHLFMSSISLRGRRGGVQPPGAHPSRQNTFTAVLSSPSPETPNPILKNDMEKVSSNPIRFLRTEGFLTWCNDDG